MHVLDWIVVGGYLLVMLGIGLWVPSPGRQHFGLLQRWWPAAVVTGIGAFLFAPKWNRLRRRYRWRPRTPLRSPR